MSLTPPLVLNQVAQVVQNRRVCDWATGSDSAPGRRAHDAVALPGAGHPCDCPSARSGVSLI